MFSHSEKQRMTSFHYRRLHPNHPFRSYDFELSVLAEEYPVLTP